jgi:hypothetical protein
MRSLRPLAESGLSNLPDNPTLLPDDGPPLSWGLSRASSGQQLEPDDSKPLTYAGYSGYRRVCRVLREGMGEDTPRRVGGGDEEVVLKTWCELKTGRTPGPSDVAEERRRPCRAQWGQDLHG